VQTYFGANWAAQSSSQGGFAGGAVKRALASKDRDARLNSEKLDDEAVTVLAAGLASNTTIARLTLAYNQLGINGVTALSVALKTNTALRWLELDSASLRDTELRALLTGLKANRGLRVLTVSRNKFSEEAGRELLAVYKEHPTLVRLHVVDCGLSKKLKDEFEVLSVPKGEAACAAGR
jgi:Ran GTPase-activating protein (RanGAP) involved in mRNA processing and transport